MLTLQETQLDAVTEVFYRLLRGEKSETLSLPPDAPENVDAPVTPYRSSDHDPLVIDLRLRAE